MARLAVVLLVGALALAVGAAAPAAPQASATLQIVGFTTSKRGAERHVIQVRSGGVIKKCTDRRTLYAVLVAGNLAAGSSYQQYWSSRGKKVFMGERKALSSAIVAPRQVYIGFTNKTALKNGKYIFQFILDGRPSVLGNVTRKC